MSEKPPMTALRALELLLKVAQDTAEAEKQNFLHGHPDALETAEARGRFIAYMVIVKRATALIEAGFEPEEREIMAAYLKMQEALIQANADADKLIAPPGNQPLQ